MAALAVRLLSRPRPQRVVPVAGIAIGGLDLFAGGVDAAMGAGLVLLFFGQVTVSAEFRDLRWRRHRVRRNVADRRAMLLRGTVTNPAIDVGASVFVCFEIRDGVGVARGATVRFLRRDGGECRDPEEH